MMKLIDKDKVETILRNLWKEDDGHNPEHRICYNKALQEVQCKLDSLEVKEMEEVPATVMINKFGNRFISSWSGLKEYDGFKIGQEIKIRIPKV